LKAADNEDINTMIEAHQHKYYWYQNNYAHIIFLEKKDFIAEVDEILKLKTADEIRQEIKKIEDNIHDKCNERDKLKSSLTDDTQNILYFFQKMAGLRDDRKKAHCIMLTSMRRVLEAIAKKVDIDIELLEYIAYWEADEILDDKEKFLNKLKDREKGVFSISYRNEGFYIIGGDEANAINDAIQSKILGDKTEIVGKSASTGKVQGIVKIINRVADFSNLNRGDILVSCMTRPEFVPIIEKAAAIVTDEGGITCHAAIVSRELGIPCIVGTDIATKLLKDGDLVEVDADKGIVKKI